MEAGWIRQKLKFIRWSSSVWTGVFLIFIRCSRRLLHVSEKGTKTDAGLIGNLPGNGQERNFIWAFSGNLSKPTVPPCTMLNLSLQSQVYSVLLLPQTALPSMLLHYGKMLAQCS